MGWSQKRLVSLVYGSAHGLVPDLCSRSGNGRYDHRARGSDGRPNDKTNTAGKRQRGTLYFVLCNSTLVQSGSVGILNTGINPGRSYLVDWELHCHVACC